MKQIKFSPDFKDYNIINKIKYFYSKQLGKELEEKFYFDLYNNVGTIIKNNFYRKLIEEYDRTISLDYVISKNNVIFYNLEELTFFNSGIANPGIKCLEHFGKINKFPEEKNYTFNNFCEDVLERDNNKLRGTVSEKIAKYYIEFIRSGLDEREFCL